MAGTNGSSTLIPASRFGEVLREARVARGESLDDLEARTQGRFTAGRLEQIEFGEIAIGDDEVNALAKLYDVEVGTLTPNRSELVIDLVAGTVRAGRAEAHLDDVDDPDEVVTHYLSLVYSLRGLEPGTPLPMRDLDVTTLARALDRPEVEVERALHQAMAGRTPDLARRANHLRRRVVIPAAGILVAATAIGTLVFVQADDTDRPTPPSSASPATSSPVSAAPAAADLFTPVPVEPGETSVEVPPLVLERDDPADPVGDPVEVEAAPLDPTAIVEVEPGETSVELPPLVLERDDPTDPVGTTSVVD